MEWELAEPHFKKLCKVFGTPDVDLFASRINNKVPTFVSFLPEPEAWRVNAFTFPWNDGLHYYLFPPFSLVGDIIEILAQGDIIATLVTPDWPSKPWYSRLQNLTNRRLFIRKDKDNLRPHGNPKKLQFMSSVSLQISHFSGTN